MAELIVRRRATWWQDRRRDYLILVDGTEAGRIGNGGNVRLQVAPGRHRVQLKLDRCASPALDVDVADGAAQLLDCGPNATPLTAVFYVALRPGHYLGLQGGSRRAAVPALRDLGAPGLPAAS